MSLRCINGELVPTWLVEEVRSWRDRELGDRNDSDALALLVVEFGELDEDTLWKIIAG